ncbi:MAG: hypothetical protein KatS3mg131_2471 [Candidatus Tectimicrobiota bacterium]|nr:MAG: hypothetical protein KatS3mg131_2471 [Candidatus Tectomicrobia bacterium]
MQAGAPLVAFEHVTLGYGRRPVLREAMVACAILALASIAAAGSRYVISPQKSQFHFKAYSLLARPLGTFRVFGGEILADAHNPEASRVHFVIDAASIDTGNAKRDKHLRSEDFLFVAQYPTITFTSTAVRHEGGKRYVVEGELEIRGVRKRIAIPVTVTQQAGELVVQGSVRLCRRDFGINYNAFFNPIRNEVDVIFTIVAVHP